MIITLSEIRQILLSKNISIKGCIHVGAHDCEELSVYNQLQIKSEDINVSILYK